MTRFPLALAALVLLQFHPALAQGEEVWSVESGRTTFSINEALLNGLGLSVHVDQTKGHPPVDPFMEEPHWTFPLVGGSNLQVRVDVGVAPPFRLAPGIIQHTGSLTLRDDASGRSFIMRGVDIEILPPDVYEPFRGADQNPLYMRDERGRVVLELAHSMLRVTPDNDFDIYYMNLRLADGWADDLGRPELAGLVIGVAQMTGTLTPISGTSIRTPFSPQYGTGFLDVSLGLLSGLQQFGREGSTVGLTMATTSCNVGDVDVPWEAPMMEDHPMIAMALYRLRNGKFDQIGVSWMKHGFFALSNSQCIPCQNPSDGSFLGVGCSDTYGPGNNADRRYLGPRSEVDPYLGTWSCSGSHFQGGAADCVRGHGSSGHDGVAHRLQVEDSELDQSGADYFYEAYYVVRGDQNRHNNYGSVEVSMGLTGSTWFFSDEGSLIEGPAIERWGEQRTEFSIPGDGKVILAVETTDLGGGSFHYQYALLNFDSEREIRSFSLPVEGVPGLSGFTFNDADEDALNDWAALVSGGLLTWSTDTYTVDPDANALTFGEMFSFGFDADVPPDTLTTTLGLFRHPEGESVGGPILGPTNDSAAPSLPTVQSSSHTPGSWSSNPSVNVNWFGALDPDGIGGYSFEWDKSLGTLPDTVIDTPDSSAISTPLSEEDNHWFHLRVVDGMGNWTVGAVHLGPFLIDTTNPVNPLTATADRPNATWSSDGVIDVIWSPGSDPGMGSGVAGYSFQWNGLPVGTPDTFIETADTLTANPATSGSYYFHLRTVDGAGNGAGALSTVHVGPLFVDITPPQDPGVWNSEPPAGAWSQDNTLRVQWSGYSDAHSGVNGFSFLFDQGALTLPDSLVDSAPGDSAEAGPVGDGTHWFHLRTRDNVGNWTSTVHEGPFLIDTTPPSGAISTPAGSEVWMCTTDETLVWTESDSTSGIDSVEVRLSTDDGATFPILIANPNPGDGSYQWTIPETPGDQMRIQLRLKDAAGLVTTLVSEAFEIECGILAAPDQPAVAAFGLGQSMPNPTGSSTRIAYSIAESSPVNLSIWNAQGRLVRVLVDHEHGPGLYETSWDGKDTRGQRASSGIYYYRMRTPSYSETRKLMLLR